MEALGLNAQQVITNIIGFLIFWWLMGKYAWKPILKFMDERRDELSNNFRKIEQEKTDLDKLRQQYQNQIATIDEEASRRISEAIKNGQSAARQIEEDARARAQAILAKARMDTERITEEARLSLKNFVINVGVEAGRKAAMGVLDETTHRKLVERYVEEMTNVR
ncbi:MAG: F0F1 ATP synthase subunit B [bacterium]|nr:F0F1 ATP synthase subunit B [bacterium]